MKKRKKERSKAERPSKAKPPKFLRILTDWRPVNVTVMDGEKTGHIVAYVLSPQKKVYRYANAWENPSLVIDAPILPAEHHIRLMRVKNKKIKKEVLRALRRR